ncbi:MAG: helix-turn-helix transcriptional regulator [Clostridia bacterium]|nr:helix-turn-helix transcriptional regulator [Clostridia bacterium]
MIIGDRIRYYRKQRGYTQREFAKKLCISTQAVSKWENGHTFPDLPTFIRIADLLYVSLDDLAGTEYLRR